MLLPVYRGGVVVAHALLDDVDHRRFSGVRWTLNGKGYVRRSVRRGGRVVTVWLHREVLGLNSDDPFVDHRNRNPLDCRRANLRLATHAQNCQNKDPRRGVRFYPQKRKWRARAMLAQQAYHIGYFDTEEAAYEALSEWRREHMEFAEADHVA